MSAAFANACDTGDVAAVRRFVAQGADPNYVDQGFPVLCSSAQYGHVEVIRALVEAGATVDQPNKTGSTPLFMASQQGHVAAVAALLGGGVAVDQPRKGGATPLYVASQQGHVAVVEALLGGGATVDQPDKDGATPLYIASQKGHVAVVKVLLRARANPALTKKDGFTAAQAALQANFPMIVALCDPRLAAREGQKLKDAFQAAPLAHVLSTRFRRPTAAPEGWSDERQGPWKDSCDPNASAAALKFVLEARSTAKGIKVFNPNYDNAFLMGGNKEKADGVWLKNWREVGLEAAKRTGGACVQLVTPPGLSPMQAAEASMARSEGVRIVRIDCTGMKYAASEPKLMRLPAFAELVGSGGAVLPPLSRDQMIQMIAMLLRGDKPTDDECARLEAERQRAAPEGVPPVQPEGSSAAAAVPEPRFTLRAGFGLAAGHPMCKSENGHALTVRRLSVERGVDSVAMVS
eukprot:COSAG01_NODE_11655_length_1886_cov_4.837717_1_plen_463_part_00